MKANLGMRLWWGVAACAAGLMVAAAAQAQVEVAEGVGPVVSATGTATLKVRADLMRVQLTVEAQGKDLKDALANLKTLETADNEKLAGAGAASGAIQWGEASVGVISQRQQKIIQMMKIRRQGVKATGEPLETASVTATLKADLPLEGKSYDEILVLAQVLGEKIKKMSLALPPTTMPADAEAHAAEVQEEAEEDTGEHNGEAVPPGAVTFIYVHKITEAEYDQAMAEAFANAKRDALRLAKAAGVQIGSLKSLSGRTNSAAEVEEMYNGGSEQRYIYMMMQQQVRSGAQVDEAYSAQPGEIALQVAVSAAFTIK